MKALKLLALAATGLLFLGACSPQAEPTAQSESPSPVSNNEDLSPSETPTEGPTLSGEITVFAAASLTNVFTDIAKDFENANPGVKVNLQFDGSSALATQILEGATVDVFASADQKNMDKVIDGGKASGSTVFTSNTLTLTVPADNPAHIQSITDLQDPKVTTVMCAPEVPCGALALSVTEASGVSITASSLEQNVSAVATKVSLGEADAGFVYTTDISSSQGKLVDIGLPDKAQSVAKTPYPITVITDSQTELAQAFMTYVLTQGQSTLTQAGFGSL